MQRSIWTDAGWSNQSKENNILNVLNSYINVNIVPKNQK